MTDVEVNLSHKDNEIQMLLAKFDSDKDSNGPVDTTETDPLALDDEEKMELDVVSKDGVAEKKDCFSNGTKQSDKVTEIAEVISDDTNPVKSAKDIDDPTEPAESPVATGAQNEESETSDKKLDKEESMIIPNSPPKENACPVINPTIPIKPVEEIKIEKEVTDDKTKPCLDIHKSGDIVTKEFISKECDAKEQPMKEKQSEDVPVVTLPNIKQDIVDLPVDIVKSESVQAESLSRQDNCTSGDSDMDDALHIAEDTEKKDNGFCKRRIAETDPVKSDQCPSKKLCQELQDTFEKHNSMLSDYMSTTSNNSVEEIDRHTETLISEIETLRELAQTKETEWNNILHLKKVKEEILLRLIRKKKIILLDKVNQDIVDNNKKNSTHKKYLSSNRNTVQDRYDEITNLGMGKSFSGTTNAIPSITSSSMMIPATSLPYCPVSMPSYGIDKNNINYYGNKKIVPKPVVMMPGPRLPAYQMPDRNGLLDSYGMPMGRQGPIKDVQSIIADYRQRHPEVVPRRGRRMKTLLNAQSPQMAVGPRPIAPHPDHSMDLGLLLGRMEGNPHMSVSEALASQQSAMLGQSGVPTSLPNGMSFKDVLVQFANLTGQPPPPGGMGPGLPPPPPYPEVTLHPVVGGPAGSKATTQNQQNNSLLHGILTKSQTRQDNRFSTFSPTLARLLTAPEKVVAPNTQPTSTSYSPQKNCMEITITPVPVGNQSTSRNEPEVVQLDDFEEAELDEDTADRPLVIDEGGRNEGPGPGGEGALELSESEVPECQGCHRKEAQFVCAGCANQWYCSRECQVSAWDDHSEVCSG